eukprot:symbB.v1.2.024913.t1/scaffold2391.1/size80316/1
MELLGSRNLSGKFALVTGGDSGLGFSIALALAKRGAEVVIANHNATSGEIAAKNLSKLSGSKVEALPLNLGSLQSVRNTFESFQQKYGARPLNFLINDAGITGRSTMTEDGFERNFEVDFLGHFLLTDLLLPALRRGAPSRVVIVSSGAHENACEAVGWPRDCFKDFTYLPPPVVPQKEVTIHTRLGPVQQNSSTYDIAKFLNAQHAAALATREAEHGIQSCSLTPGFVLTSMTERFMNTSGPTGAEAICKQQRHPDPSIPENPCPFSSDEGAAVLAFCATGQIRSGAYYSRDFACQERPIAMQGFTETMQLELYEKALDWVKPPTAVVHGFGQGEGPGPPPEELELPSQVWFLWPLFLARPTADAEHAAILRHNKAEQVYEVIAPRDTWRFHDGMV